MVIIIGAEFGEIIMGLGKIIMLGFLGGIAFLVIIKAIYSPIDFWSKLGELTFPIAIIAIVIWLAHREDKKKSRKQPKI